MYLIDLLKKAHDAIPILPRLVVMAVLAWLLAASFARDVALALARGW